MEKSFTSWRESRNLGDIENDSDDNQDSKSIKVFKLINNSDSESDSDVVSSSQSNFNVPDSDEESFNPVKCIVPDSDKKRLSVVPDSDQASSDEFDGKEISSMSGSVLTKHNRKSNQGLLNSSNNSKSSTTIFSEEEEESSPDITKFAKRKHKKFVISSDEENISTNSTIYSYKISDDEESPPNISNSLEKFKSKALGLPIDLTLPISDSNKSVNETTDGILLPNSIHNSFDSVKHKGIITISSESEDDNLSLTHKALENEEELNAQLREVNINKHPPKSNNLNPPKESVKPVVTASALQKNSENDYSSRLESLKAEESRLGAQVKEVLKNIDTVKITLRTANMAELPDRGVRLQVNLKRFESQLRDLRYQQNTLSNEILRLQLMPNKGSVPKPIQSQPPQQKMFKLPTTTTDTNAMGKRALETHRVQQALTVDALRGLHNSLKNCPSEEMLSSDPVGLKVELMPHQKYALSWLLWREREKPSGGILADDMGLGKTLTMISLILKSNEENQEKSESEESENEASSSNWLSSQRHKSTRGKTLVVCPASLLGQWEGEAQRRVRRGIIDVLVHHGQNREKKARRLAKPDIVITTYNIVSRDCEQLESPLFQIKWERVILDEAHQIRNNKTKTAQGVFRLKARSRWALTGTPVQNKELDLYALLKFLRCSPFDDLGVWKTWVDNRDAAGKQRMNTIIKSIMLRRTKKGLQEMGQLRSLPEKKLNTVLIKMDTEESAVYEKLLLFSKTLFSTFLHKKAEKENALQGTALNRKVLESAEDPFKNHPELARLHRQMMEIQPNVQSHHILVLLLRLRQFCCHPSLIQTMLEKDDISNVGIEDSDGLDIDLMDKMTRMSLVNKDEQLKDNKTDLTALDKENPLFAKDRLSSKMKRVLETVENILTTNDKLLVVSQWVTHLDLVHSVLQEKKVKCLRLTGQIAVKNRAEIVDQFNRKDHGPRVLLLSLSAGGVGLNLVGANHLLLLDLHWNPQLENQACDRIYRVGQEKGVHIYKFVTSETVEETVLNLQEKKLGIADSVLTGAKSASSKLSLEDLKMLFKVN